MATFVASAAGAATAALPAGTTTGDWVVVFAYRDLSAALPTLPANWTTITSRAVANAILVSYREKDASWSAMPTFTNATRCVAVTVRPASGKALMAGVSAVQGATSTAVAWAVQTLQVNDGTSVILRGFAHTRPDAAWTTPANHTLIDSNGTRPGFGTYRKTTSTDMAAASITVSRSDVWSSAQVEIRDFTPTAVTQGAYTFYDDGTESGSTALAAANTAPTLDVTSGNIALQLRLRLQSTTVGDIPATDDWCIQWEKNGTSIWTDAVPAVMDSWTGAASGADFGSTTNNQGWSQSFTGNGAVISGAILQLTKIGSPTFNVTVGVYAHSGTFGTSSIPTGTALTSVTFAASTVSTGGGDHVVVLPNFQTVAGTRYVIAATVSAVGSVSNCLLIGVAQTPGHAGNSATRAASVWTSSSSDLLFQVTSSASSVAAYPSTAVTDQAATTNRLGAGSGTFVAGKISKDGLIDDLGWTGNNYTEVLFPLQLVSADLTNGDVLRFRILRNDATATMTWTATPTINVVKVIPAVTQAAYRFYDITGTEAAGVALAAQDTSITGDVTSGDHLSMLRVRMQSTTAASLPATDDWRLQYRINAGAFTNVTTTSGAIQSYNAPNVGNNDPTTERLTGGTGTFTTGKVSETGTANNIGFGGNNYIEFVYTLQLQASLLAQGDVVQFQVLKNGATTDVTYTQVPSISVTKAPPAVTQAGYRFYDQGSESGSTPLGAENTPITGNLTTGDGIGQLRVLLQSTNAAAIPATDDWQLWYRTNGGTWFAVVEGSGSVASYNDPSLTSGAATTNRLTGTGTFSPGRVSETGAVTDFGFAGNNFTELVFPVQISRVAFVDGDTITFGVSRNGPLVTITQTPQVNVVKVNSGTATFNHTWDVTASGVMPTIGGGVGSATFNWNADFTATGDHGRAGTAAVSWSSDLTAVGKMDPVGTASTLHYWTISATGVAPSAAPKQGSATFQHSWAFTAQAIPAVAQLWFMSSPGRTSGMHRGTNSANLRGSAIAWKSYSLSNTVATGGSTGSFNVTSVAGPTPGIEVDNTITEAIEWISMPIDRNVTIAGTIQLQLYELATTTALGTSSINCILERVNPQGGIVSEIGRSTNTVPSTGNTIKRNFNITPTSTAMVKGDRIRARIYFDDSTSTMVAGGSMSTTVQGDSGALGEAWVKFAEPFSFQVAEPTGTIMYLTDSAGPAVGTAVEKEMWTGRGAITTSAVTNTAAGWTAPVPWTQTAGGSQIEWYSRPLDAFTLDGLVRLNMRISQSATGVAAFRPELAICNEDGSGAVVWGASTVINSGSPGGTVLGGAGGKIPTAETQNRSWLSGPTTDVAAGKRLRLRFYLDDEHDLAMTSGRTASLYYNGPAAGATGDAWIQLPVAVTEYAPDVTIAKYQFFEEGTETGAVPAAAVNTPLSIDTFGAHNLQLRFQLQSTTGLAVPATDWQLEWDFDGTDWSPISNTNAVIYFNSASLTDAEATTARLPAGSGSFVTGKVSEDGLVNAVGWSGNNYTELVFSIQARFITFLDGESVVFRVVSTSTPPNLTHAIQPQLIAFVQAGDDSTGVMNPDDGRDTIAATATAAPVHTGTFSLTDGRDTLAATVETTVPTSTSTLAFTDGIDTMVAEATTIDARTATLAVSDRIDAFGATATSEPPISESTLEFTDNPDTIVATGTLEPPIHAGTLSLADGEDTLSARATAGIYLNRSVTQAPRNGTTSHTVNFTPATAGNLLLAFAEGSVTSTTPAGWELRSSAVNNTGLYCWTKIATAGESSFTTTHNGSNYPCAFAVYEYPAGSAFAVENSAINQSSTADNPIVTLNPVAVYTVFTAYGWGYTSPSVDPAPNSTWIGGVEDVDVFEPFATTDGYLFGIAIQDGVTGVTADTATPTVNNTAGGNSERITVALNLAGSTTHTGNFSGTDGADALTASVSTTAPTITATLALTDGRDTLVASGDRTVPLFTGAMAQTDGIDTLVAAGSTTAPTHTGAIAQTDGADALAATVSTTAPTFTSTLALTDGLDALVASGSTTLPTFTGTLALTDGQDTLVASATAGEVTTGTLALTDNSDTIVATADTTPPTLTSTLSVSDSVDTLTASLSLTVPLFVSTASQTDGADSIVTTVNITPPPNPSTLSISDGQDTLAALVSAGAVGAAVLALADGVDTITAAGTTTAPTFTASLALTDGLDALVSVPTTVVPSQEATASVADGLDTIIATASTIAPTFTSTATATDGVDGLTASAETTVPVFMSNLVAADNPDTLAASASATTPVFTSTLELADGEDTIIATVAHAAPGNSAGGVTVTDGEDTLVASASATIPTLTGTLAITDGVDTLAIAVQFLATNEPTLASTDGADTLVASASATVPLLLATLVAFDSLDTIVSTGSTVPPTVTASVDVTETPDILSAVGTHAAPGNSAAALTVADGLDAMVATATRTIPTVTATVAVSDGVDTLEATVQSIPINTVALAQADGNDTIVTSTSLTVPLLVGFVIVTEGTDTMSAVATSVIPTFTSTLAFIDGADSLDAFATAAVPLATSTVTFTDNRDTIVTSVETIVPIHTATLDLTDSPDTVAASVVAGAVGAAVLAISDGLDTMVAVATTVVPTFTGSISVTSDGRDSLDASIATIPPTHSGTLALTDKADTLAAPAVSTPPLFESTLTFTDGQDTLVTTVAHVVPTFTATATSVEGRDTFVAVGLHAPPGNSAGGFGATDGRDTMVAAALCLFGHTILSGYALEMKRIDKLRACTRIDDDREMERMDKPTVIRPATSEKGILVP